MVKFAQSLFPFVLCDIATSALPIRASWAKCRYDETSPQREEYYPCPTGKTMNKGNAKSAMACTASGATACSAVCCTDPSTPSGHIEVHDGPCADGYLGDGQWKVNDAKYKQKAETVEQCKSKCETMPECGYMSYHPTSKDCVMYSPLQGCPAYKAGSAMATKYTGWKSYKVLHNHKVLKQREIRRMIQIHTTDACGEGFLSASSTLFSSKLDCAEHCAKDTMCRYISYAQSVGCSSYSSYSMCPPYHNVTKASKDKYKGYQSWMLLTDGEDNDPFDTVSTAQLATLAQGTAYWKSHTGHCATGWMEGHQATFSSGTAAERLKQCVSLCFETPTCSYFAWAATSYTCQLYRNDGCMDDGRHREYTSFKIQRDALV